MSRLYLAVLVILAVCSLTSPARSEWWTLSMADGLPHDGVGCIVEDRSGNLWLCGYGMTRYDGLNMTYFDPLWHGLYTRTVLDVCMDRSGNLWFGVLGGVEKYDGVDWTTYTTDDGLAHRYVYAVCEDSSGAMWFGTQGGASRFDGMTWTTYTTADGLVYDGVREIFADSSGNLWFGTRDGVTRYDGASWTTYTTADGLADDYVRAIIQDSSGAMWFGTWEGGLSRYDGESWETYTADDVLASNTVRALCQDHLGNIWVGTEGGLTKFDGSHWRTYTTSDVLPDNYVQAIIEDSSGAMWFGTNEGGVCRYDRVEYGVLTTADGLAQDLVYDVFQDSSGDFWFGGNWGGVSRFDGEAWKHYTMDDGLVFDLVFKIFEDSSGNMWFGTGEGLSQFDGVNWETREWPDGPGIHNTIRDICEDSSGDLWFATGKNLFRYDGQSWTSYSDEVVFRRQFHSILEDTQGNMWFGLSDGIKKYDGNDWTFYSTEAGFENKVVSTIAEDSNGDLWFGSGPSSATYGGLARYDGTSWTQYTTADGLAHNTVYRIIRDSAGVLWMGTRGGGISTYKDGVWGQITKADGLCDDHITCIMEDRSGTIWIAYNEECGVTYHVPDRVSPQTVLQLVPPSLSSSSAHSIGYGAAYGEGADVTYSYSIDSAPWTDWSPQTFWTGTGIVDGVHTFAVKARDFMGNVDPTPAVCSFEVDATPPLPLILSPSSGQAVRDSVHVVGTADDPRFLRYRLEARPSESDSWHLLAESSSPVREGVMCGWNTSSLPDGDCELLLSVTDTLGLTGNALVRVIIDNKAPWAYETAPAVVKGSTGGDIYNAGGDVHLYFPPHCFETESEVRIEGLGEGDVPDTLAGGAISLGKGYEIAWDGSLIKAGTLELSYGESRKPWPEGTFALYTRGADSTWSRLGGTNDNSILKVSSLLTEPGLYSLFVEAEGMSSGGTLSGLTITPRVFSPRGGFAAPQAAIGFTLGRPGPVTVKIYNRAGRLINEVVSGEQLTAGANLVHWDGRGREGDLVDDGIYLVTVEALGQKQVKPLAVVR